jgi:hypothetical protein
MPTKEVAKPVVQASQPAAGAQSPQTFFTGACIATVARLEALPGRRFTSFDQSGSVDPIDFLASNGFNAARVQTRPGQPLTTNGSYDNSGQWFSRELNFKLDWGGIDAQVALAKRARAGGMAIILSINLGIEIPPEWRKFSYVQMLGAIDQETKRQLRPFLQAKIQPELINLGTEASAGVLYQETLPGGTVHLRGVVASSSGKALQDELRGIVPTGNLASWPQAAGYYKQQIFSCQDLLAEFGMAENATRFGLHTHGQYFGWKQSVVYSTDAALETSYVGNGISTDFAGIIPDKLLQVKASDLIDIMGFSLYPAPPQELQPAGLDGALPQLASILPPLEAIVKRYGRHTTGPYAGQWRKQALVVEFASQFAAPAQTDAQQAQVTLLMKTLRSTGFFLGALWWEPWYGYNNWFQGQGSLSRGGPFTGLTHPTILSPIATLKTWTSQ